MKTKKQGFTLVELLAVIVIIAVIALITTPIVLNTISKADLKAFKISVEEVTNNVDKYLLKKDLKKLPQCDDEHVIIRDIDFLKNRTSFSKDSYICYDNNRQCDYIYAKSSDDDKKEIYALGCMDNIVYIKGNGNFEPSNPEYNTLSFVRTSNSITVIIDWYDSKNQIEEVLYAIKEKDADSWSKWQSSNIFTKLKTNTEYEIKSIAKNNLEVSGYAKGSTSTLDINPPTYAVDESGWATSKVVTITYPNPREGETYTYSYSLDNGQTWTTTSDRETKITFTKNGSVIARVYDGNNYKTASSYTVSQIDTTEPKYSTLSYTRISSKITVNINWYDNESGVKSVKYAIRKKGDTTWSDWQTSNIFKKLKLNTEYEIKTIAENNAGVTDTASGSTSTLDIDPPTYAINKSGWATSKVVTITYPSPRTGESYTYSYSLDGGDTWTTTSSTTKELTFTKNGSVIARVYDGDNYKTAIAYAVSQIDTTTPSCSLTIASGTKGDNGWYTSKVNFQIKTSTAGASGITYSDPTTSTRVDYSNSVSSGNYGSKSLTLSADGTYSLKGYVKTGAGKTSTCSLTVKIDQTKPSFSLPDGNSIPSENSWCLQDDYYFTANDKTSGLSTSYCDIKLKSTSEHYDTVGLSSGKATYKFEEADVYSFDCVLRDKAGNQNNISTNMTSVKPCAGWSETYTPVPDMSNGTITGLLSYGYGPKYVVDTVYGTKLYMISDGTSAAGGTQYGPYRKLWSGCYQVNYIGEKLNSSNLSFTSYSTTSGYYNISNLTKSATKVSYIVKVNPTVNVDTGVEFVSYSNFTGTSSNAPYITSIKIEYLGDLFSGKC